MKTIKRILIFLKLKWNETAVEAWKWNKTATLIFPIAFIISLSLMAQDDNVPIWLSMSLSLMLATICPMFYYLIVVEGGPAFSKWIKDNWEKAGKMVDEDR